MAERWYRFFNQFRRDFKLWLVFVAALMVSRAAFLAVYHHEMLPAHHVANICSMLAYAIRFDLMVATYWAIVPLAASVLCAAWSGMETVGNRLRTGVGVAFFATTTFLSAAAIEYYREFHDSFNEMLFKTAEDDFGAILSTVYADYHLIRHLTLVAAMAIVGYLLCQRFVNRDFISAGRIEKYTNSHGIRFAISLSILVLVMTCVRGSVGYRPLQAKDAGITADRMINKSAMNPYVALLTATVEHCGAVGQLGMAAFWPDNNIATALANAFPDGCNTSQIDDSMERSASGPRVHPPRHVFLLLLESYDAWPLLDKYAGLGLADGARQLAREGLHLQAYLASGAGTIESFSTLITGMPFVSLTMRLENAGRGPLPTSLPDTFRRLGYRTRLFYSGYLSWQELGDFATSQGFDEVYGAANAVPNAVRNDWGVADQYLYDLVSKTVTDDRPSFNFILTTMYHPPYNFDLQALGTSLPTVPKELDSTFTADRATMLNILGHRRYADQAMEKFVRLMEPKLHLPLFAITGDHYSHRFINDTPTLFESSAVPLILYGKDVLRGVEFPKSAAGSHIDLGATLIESVAPQGFKYYAMGHNLLDPKAAAIGYDLKRIVSPDCLLEMGASPILEPLPGKQLTAALADMPQTARHVRAMQAVSWWRTRRGSATGLLETEEPREIMAGRPVADRILR